MVGALPPYQLVIAAGQVIVGAVEGVVNVQYQWFAMLLLLADAIEKVYAGEIYIDSYISNKVIKSLITKNDVEIAEDNKSAYSKLSLREQQILKLLIDGVPIKDIAEELFISSKTVENHKASIMVKLKCKNMTELIRYAISIGLIDV